jgi:murein DD-endopeptidase MepM/ murein hydrolase activator NlpD
VHPRVFASISGHLSHHAAGMRSPLQPVSALLSAALALAGMAPTATAAPGPNATPGVWPVSSHLVVAGFDPPLADWLAGHRGVDLSATTGEPVRAIVHGRVSFAGRVAGKPVVAISVAGDRRLTYEPVVPLVATGQDIAAGQVIGRVAATGGHCGGRVGCLHVGLIDGSGYRDPLSLLRRPIVLKPVARSRLGSPEL